MTEEQFQDLDGRALRMVELLAYIGDTNCRNELDGRIDEARAYIREPGTTYADGDRVVSALVSRGNAILGGHCYEGYDWLNASPATAPTAPASPAPSKPSTKPATKTTTKTPTPSATSSTLAAVPPSSRVPMYVAGAVVLALAGLYLYGGRR